MGMDSGGGLCVTRDKMAPERCGCQGPDSAFNSPLGVRSAWASRLLLSPLLSWQLFSSPRKTILPRWVLPSNPLCPSTQKKQESALKLLEPRTVQPLQVVQLGCNPYIHSHVIESSSPSPCFYVFPPKKSIWKRIK